MCDLVFFSRDREVISELPNFEVVDKDASATMRYRRSKGDRR
jgi:hypothetical protein